MRGRTKRRTSIGLAVAGMLLAGPAGAQQPTVEPEWTIDVMLSRGAITAEQRAGYLRDFTTSCLARATPAVTGKPITSEEMNRYCRCSANLSTSRITAGDIQYMAEHGNTSSPAMMAKLDSIARQCAADINESRAGQ